jgi:maltooligosyltrehalose trehalohydrolase
VALVLGTGEEHAMAVGQAGWHRLTVDATHGTDYGYRLDGGPVRPDPASRWQPEGVHGLSRVLDPARLPWRASEDRWRPPPLGGALIYELHVGTFTPQGSFDAAAARLDELAVLGVTHVEVMPVNAYNGTAGWGYDGVAWYAVHEPYGGPAGLARFVGACHAAGLGVLLDVVYNHLGPSGNYLPEYGPYLTGRHTTPWGAAVNVDGPGSDPVRSFIVGNALGWFADFHVDGLRLDAVHELIDGSAVPILAELSTATDALATRLRRPLLLVAESDRCDPQTVRPREVGGLGLAGQWADDLHHAIHTAVSGEHDGYYGDYDGLPDVARAYRGGFLFDGSRYSPFRQRTPGAPVPDDVPGHRLVCCVQNHDQIGNRAYGDRLETVAGPELTRVAVVLLCAAPSTPLMFMGEEYGETRPFRFFSSHPEPELHEAVRSGRREEFGSFAAFAEQIPDPQDPGTVRASTLDWARSDSPEGRARRALWSDLLRERRRQPALANGRRDLVEVHRADADTLVLVRRDPDAPPVLVAVNLSDSPTDCAAPAAGRSWRLLLCSDAPRYGGDGTPGADGARAEGGRAGDGARRGGGERVAPDEPDEPVLRLPARSASLWTLDEDR